MATITGCTLYKNSDGSIDRYVVQYTSTIIPAGLSVPEVNIRSTDVDDITNLDQVKAAALTKIACIEAFVQKEDTQVTNNINL